MGNDKRRDLRVPSYAKAILTDGHIPGYIRDLSSSGCQVAFIQPLAAREGDIITVQVIAEHDPAIVPFHLRLRIRRVVEDPPWHTLGTQVETIDDPREAEAFGRLVSYYTGVGT